MMKLKAVLGLCLLITACAVPTGIPPAATLAPMVSTVTLEPSPTIAQPAPTDTIELTPTPETGVEIAQSLKYDQEYLAAFQVVETKTVTVGGVEQKGVVGVDQNGEHILALEIKGKMTRVGEWSDPKGNNFYVYVNPEYDPLQRILATEKTPQVLTDFMFESLAKGQFYDRTGGDPEKLKAIIFDPANAGKLMFQIPVADPEAGDWAVKWVNPEVEPDFTKPIEIMTVFLPAEVEKFMQSELGSKLMDDRGDESVGGYLMWIAPDGHIQIIKVCAKIETQNAIGGIPKNLEGQNGVLRLLRAYVSWDLLAILDILSKQGSTDAFWDTFKYSINRFDARSRPLLDFSIEIE
jgi:hypothetical protein